MKKSKDKKSKAAKEAASPKATPKKQEEDEMASLTLRFFLVFDIQSALDLDDLFYGDFSTGVIVFASAISVVKKYTVLVGR
jgi:hypothetical protein